MKKILIVLLCLVSLVLTSIALASEQVTLVVNARQLFPDVPPQIIGGRVMVPIRIVAENLGAEVAWDSTNQVVWITTPPPPEPYATLETLPYYRDYVKATLDRWTNPIEIVGPEDFQREVKEALTLLEKKAPKVYLNVEAYLSRIVLEDNPPADMKNAVAYIDPETNNSCVFCSSNFYSAINALISAFQQKGVTLTPSLLIAGIIVHETTHAQLNETRLTLQLKPTDAEFIAELAAYRALETLGAPAQYLEAHKKTNIQNYLYK
ncbi:MAG: copper amine oxidase N-terminal domain-containing protein [Moorellales bacterium]